VPPHSRSHRQLASAPCQTDRKRESRVLLKDFMHSFVKYDVDRGLFMTIKILKKRISHFFLNQFCKQKFEQKIFNQMPKHLTDFIKLNRQYWNANKNKSQSNNYILIEGHLVESGPNYLLRTASLAKYIEELTSYTPLAYIPRYSFCSTYKTLLFKSFGIQNFLYYKFSLLNWFKALFSTVFILLKIKTGEQLINLTHKNILIGDLIYDEILKHEHIPTLKYVDHSHFKYIFSSLFYFYSYQDTFKQFNIKYVISTHTMYSEYGLLARLGIAFKAHIFETTDLNLFSYDHMHKELQIPVYHQGMEFQLKNYLKKIDTDEKHQMITDVNHMMEKRFSGELNQYDVQLAYGSGKILYAASELKNRLSIKNSKPCVVIFMHVLTDAPHCSNNLLFRDYYDWFIQTIDYIRSRDDVNWIIKPHPSAKLYGETVQIQDVLNNMLSENIYIVPGDISTQSLINICDVVVTAQGTVGMEFSCLGIPVIIAGSAFYKDFGFTISPKTKEEYFDSLANVKNIVRLSAQQIENAKLVFYAYHKLLMKSNIIDTDILNDVWGYSSDGINTARAWERVNKKLVNINPRDKALFDAVNEVININN
jgi:hypothetical protein